MTIRCRGERLRLRKADQKWAPESATGQDYGLAGHISKMTLPENSDVMGHNPRWRIASPL